jgi:bacillithiol biosynthesis deacetylase BshB1
LGTRGTIATRHDEAANAAKIMGVAVRQNLKMRDGFFKNDEEHQLKIIQTIRQYKPPIVLCNAPADRHPDHARSSQLVQDAAFLSGLQKIQTLCPITQQPQAPHRPSYTFMYIQDTWLDPDFVVDISHVMDKKMLAIQCYTTQFYNPQSTEQSTYISNPLFLETVKGKNMQLGKSIGAQFAEGFITKKYLGVQSLDAFIQIAT